MRRSIMPLIVLSICAVLMFLSGAHAAEPRIELPKELTLDLGNGIQIQAVLVPAGKFQMGFQEESEKFYTWALPGRQVTISKPFYMGKFPVTQAQWLAIMPDNRSRFKGPRHPIDGVLWEEANEFCKKLSQKVSLPVRLPTEAEWEYGCRAGTKTAFFFGNDPNGLADYGWHEANSNDATHPVGLKKPNPWGLYDVCGNIWEWCHDWYAPLDKETDPVTDPTGPEESRLGAHVLRGGAWHTDATFSQSAVRGGDFPCGEGGPASWDNASCSGFRIVVTVPLTDR